MRELTDNEYRNMYYGKWVGPTEDELELQRLAGQYHKRCDHYDQIVCKGKSIRTGEPIPANGDELGAINRYARNVRNDVILQGAMMGFTEKQIREAIQQYARR